MNNKRKNTSKKSGSHRRKVLRAYKDLLEYNIQKNTSNGTISQVLENENNGAEAERIPLEAINKELPIPNADTGHEGSVPILLKENYEEPTLNVIVGNKGSTANDFIVVNEGFTPDDFVENESSTSNDFVENKGSTLNDYERHSSSEEDSVCDDITKSKMTGYEKICFLRNGIRKWTLQHNISQSALKDLAKVLNKLEPNSLPDPRTLMKTPREIVITKLSSGEYWHNGLKQQITKILEKWKKSNYLQQISLCFNIDGLPIYNSSKHQFWPILCSIHEKPDIVPLIIGVYAGLCKPQNLNEFLLPFVEEMKELLQNGIEFKDKKTAINVRCFTCDSPARAMIKGVQNYNGKHGCQKCTIVGEYSHISHTVTFDGVNYPARNDQDFRSKKYGSHHKTDSPLLSLPIDMVESFPVADSLHLIDLGIMKRLLIGWRDGNFGKKDTKWRASDVKSVNDFLNTCKTPSEIHRSVRSLDNLAHWKGSEFRTFLLYLSIVILKDVLCPDAMNHFLTLFCAVTICSNENYFKFLPTAKELLVYFVTNFKKYYGADYVTSNLHNLSHVVDEVERFGKLQSFSAYPYENRLYTIKNLLKQGNRPLAQIAKRLTEYMELEEDVTTSDQSETNYPYLKKNLRNQQLILHFNGFMISSKEADKYFMTNSGDIMETRCIEIKENKIHIECYQMNNKMDVFSRPINSSHMNIFKCKLNTKTECLCFPKDVKCKLVTTSYKSELYFVPLLHTL